MISVIKDYFLSIRPHIVLTSVPCWLLGVSLAYSKGYFNLSNAILALIGVLFLHLSVNAFNEVFDYLRGNDSIESLSEYSGGGGYLVKGLLTPFQMGTWALILFIVGTSIGVFLALQHKIIIIIGFIGILMILLYTPLLKPIGLGEIAMIVGFSCISVGSYICMFDSQQYLFDFYTFLLFLLPGLWKSCVLLINEFPDYENDKKANVKNWVVRFGRKKASMIYFFLMLIFYSIILYLFFIGYLKILSLLAFLSFPLFIKVFIDSMNYKDLLTHIPVMRNQVNIGYISLITVSVSLILPF